MPVDPPDEAALAALARHYGLGLDEAGGAELARQSGRYSFLDPAGKAALLAEIDAYAAV